MRCSASRSHEYIEIYENMLSFYNCLTAARSTLLVYQPTLWENQEVASASQPYVEKPGPYLAASSSSRLHLMPESWPRSRGNTAPSTLNLLITPPSENLRFTLSMTTSGISPRYEFISSFLGRFLPPLFILVPI